MSPLLAWHRSPKSLRSKGNPVNTRQAERSAALLLLGAIVLNVALLIW